MFGNARLKHISGSTATEAVWWRFPWVKPEGSFLKVLEKVNEVNGERRRSCGKPKNGEHDGITREMKDDTIA